MAVLTSARLKWRFSVPVLDDTPELNGDLGLNGLPAGDCARLYLVYKDIDGNYVDVVEQYGPEFCSTGEHFQQQTGILLPGPTVAGIRSVDVHLQVKTESVWETQRTRSRTRPF